MYGVNQVSIENFRLQMTGKLIGGFLLAYGM